MSPSLPPQSDQSLPSGASGQQPHSRARKLVTTGVAIAVVVAVFAVLFGWKLWRHAGSAPAARPPAAVAATQLTPTNVPASLQAVGSLRAVRDVLLSPETAGRVVNIGFEAGQTVKAGSLLVQLNDNPERADRAAALARARLAEAQLARSKALIGSGAISREALDERTAEHDQAVAVVRQLDARIEQKQIRAPFTGQLGIRQIDLGQNLQSGDAIATLTDTSRLFVDFSVPQQQLRLLQTGGVVRVTSDAWPGRAFAATIDTIEPRISQDTRNISVRAVLPNPDNALRPGMFVNAELELPAESNQLVIPTTAIQTTALGDSVLVIRGPEARTQGQAEYVRVTIGRRLGDRVVVSEGLRAGDVIVTEGQLKVPPGAPVKVAQLLPAQEP